MSSKYLFVFSEPRARFKACSVLSSSPKKLLLPYPSAGVCPEAPQTHLYLDQNLECLELSFLSTAKQKPCAAPS